MHFTHVNGMAWSVATSNNVSNGYKRLSNRQRTIMIQVCGEAASVPKTLLVFKSCQTNILMQKIARSSCK